MRDFLGNQLDIGDKVITMDSNYNTLKLCVIIKFTPKGLRVAQLCKGQTVPDAWGQMKFPYQVVKVDSNAKEV